MNMSTKFLQLDVFQQDYTILDKVLRMFFVSNGSVASGNEPPVRFQNKMFGGNTVLDLLCIGFHMLEH